jgi:hypothetical protein
MSAFPVLATSIVRLQRPATADEIATAETRLEVQFPRIYKQFLEFHGVANIYHRAVFGLGSYTKPRHRTVCSVVFKTEFARAAIGLARHFVVIWDESHLDFECLDTSRIFDGDCPVVLVELTPGGKLRKPKQIAGSFQEWLGQVVERQMALKLKLDAAMPGQLTAMGQIRKKKRNRSAIKPAASSPNSASSPSRKRSRR